MRIFLGLLIVVFAFSISLADELKPWQIKAVELAKAEKKVKDAYWSQDVSFWVTMVDDGSNRKGFAEYLCFVLRDAGRPAGEYIAITIWNYADAQKGKLHQIGKAYCTF